MIKYVAILFIIVFTNNSLFASNPSFSSECFTSLLTKDFKKVMKMSLEEFAQQELAPSSQDMLSIASFIAYITSSPKINIDHILLAALTRVEFSNAPNKVIHLNDKDNIHGPQTLSVLARVLKKLNILKDMQNFLLEQVEFQDSDLASFQQMSNGLLILHIKRYIFIPPLKYDESIDVSFLQSVMIERDRESIYMEKKERNPFIFIPLQTEHFFLAALRIHDPILFFLLSKAEPFYNKTRLQIKDMLYPLISQERNSMHSSLKKKIYQSSPQNNISLEQIEEATKWVTKRARRVGVLKAIEEVAEQINMDARSLRYHISKYKKQQNSSTMQQTYFQEEKLEIIEQIIEIENRGGDYTRAIEQVAEQKSMDVAVLTELMDEHKKKFRSHPIRKTYLGEEKTKAVELVIERTKEIGVAQKAIKEVAEELNINDRSLSGWFYKYRKEHKISQKKIYLKNEKSRAVALVMQRAEKIGNIKQAAADIAKITNIKLGTLLNWVYTYMRKHNLSKQRGFYSKKEKAKAVKLVMNRARQVGVPKAVEEIAKKKNINAKTLIRWFYLYQKKHNLPSRKKVFPDEKKAEAIKLATERARTKKIAVVKAVEEVAKESHLNVGSLQKWFYQYRREHKLPRIKRGYDKKGKEKIVEQIIEKSEEIGTMKAIEKVAEENSLNAKTLQGWFYEYKQEHNLPSKRKSYLEERKIETVRQVRDRVNKVGVLKAIEEVAKEENLSARSVRGWFYEYKQEHNLPNKREDYSDKREDYSEERKTETIEWIIERAKKIGIIKAIKEAAEKSNLSIEIVQEWFYQYDLEERKYN